MLTVRRATERGHANHGWLDSYHTFSFADYYDPAHMHFRSLRVINEDRIDGGQGFPTHPHRDMEIITYMLEGELAHRDSMGNGSVIREGEVQGMSAGTGITHSEFNASKDKPAHLLQIWIMPNVKNVTPAYGEWKPDGLEKKSWALVASDAEGKNSIRIHQDAKVYVTVADAAKELPVPVGAGRYGWLQIGKGEVEANGTLLRAGDGVAFNGGELASLRLRGPAALVLFDLA